MCFQTLEHLQQQSNICRLAVDDLANLEVTVGHQESQVAFLDTQDHISLG